MPPKNTTTKFRLWDFLTSYWLRLWDSITKLVNVNTRQYVLRAIWIFFPSILFILLAFFIFWKLPQGKDLMVITLEDPKGKSTIVEFMCFVIALVFWVYVTWYSTRLVARAKHFQHPDNNPTWERLRIQAPRILAFTCITIILLAFFQLDYYGYPQLTTAQSYFLLGLSYAWYYLIYEGWTMFLQVQRHKRTVEQWKSFLKYIRRGTFWTLLWLAIITMWAKSFTSVIALLLALQVGLVLLMLVRKDLDEVSTENETPGLENVTPRSGFWKRAKYIIWFDENRKYVKVFMIMCLLALIFYFAAIRSISFAIFIGPFPFVLLAFGVLLGFGNILAFLSILTRTNFHIILFVFALIFGRWFDSHKLDLPVKKETDAKFGDRQYLPEYLVNWLNDPERKAILDDSTKPRYPVYFVMANGGASLSGYWTAKILSGLEDTSKGKFSKHLFCLSGASGGSVGNATFFSLLRARDSLTKRDVSFSDASGNYLRSDFLTFTLSHLLGPDIFRNIFPFINLVGMDRGRALARSLEKAPAENCLLYDSFAVKFSSLITQRGQDYKLPILCINVTRMQDGNPAVFSNIRINGAALPQNYFFNNRVDILDLLKDKRDIKLSTAVTLGASFPYISPAGRIDLVFEKPVKGERKKKDAQYFVDGGYFDNSGAGVVHEMIYGINNILANTDSLKKYLKRLDFYVIHIMNTDPKKESHDPINSMTNDLLAPFKTMMGSYGKQTTINDQRLKTYLRSIYPEDNFETHYKAIDLYDDPESNFRFSMNWVISNKQLEKMNTALHCNEAYRKEKKIMAGWKY